MSTTPSKAWRCVVCGYIHHGDAPPDECPVCGAPRSEFEPHTEQPPAAPKSVAKMWRCKACNYYHEGIEPPDECPICGAGRDQFEAEFTNETTPEPAAATTPGGLRIVIVGGGIAGLSAAEAARKTLPNASITLVNKEPDFPYYRINLTRYLAGEANDFSLLIHEPKWYEERQIEVVTGAEVIELIPAKKTVVLRSGREIIYDRLILAQGAHANLPPFPGLRREGVFAIRSFHDAHIVLNALRAHPRCVCIGGGLLGLETAGAIARNGGKVTILENSTHLMQRQLNPRAGELLKNFAATVGVKVRVLAKTKEIVGDEHVAGVLLEDGSVEPADIVIVATGVQSNTYLARRAGIEANKGLLVNDHLQTSLPDVYAAGDAAEHRGVLYGSWSAAQYQGTIAGLNAAGQKTEFGGIPRSHTLKVLGLGLTSIGRIEPEGADGKVLEEETGGNYRRFVFQNNRLVGGILLGDTGGAAALNKAIETGEDFSAALAGQPTAAAIATQLLAR